MSVLCYLNLVCVLISPSSHELGVIRCYRSVSSVDCVLLCCCVRSQWISALAMESGLSLGKKKPNVQPILSPSKEIQELFDVKFM